MADGERWLPVTGYEGSYAVSSVGRVKSLDRATMTRAGRPRRTKGMVLSAGLSGGYWVVTLCQNGSPVSRSIHSLVAEAFIGPRPTGCHINHIDGAKTNNVTENLEYVSPAENTHHAAALGLRPSGDGHWTRVAPWKIKRGADSWSATHKDRFSRGEAVHNSKLTAHHVLLIRASRSTGESFASIARRFGISTMAAFQIIKRKTWAHVA